MTDANGDPVDPTQQVALYQQSLSAQIQATKDYKTTLDKLRKLGLDDATYTKLLEDGTADQQFATALLKGGKGAIQGLDGLDGQLTTAAAKLGTSAATNLYAAGEAAAQGLVDGLASKPAALKKTMQQLADTMVKELKKKLKIKSPSEVFADLGQQTVEGMSQGMDDNAHLVAASADNLASTAVSAMKDSMAALSGALGTEIDSQPTITPVLDLTNVQAGAKQMTDMLAAPIVGGTSLDQATAISSATAAAQGATDTTDGSGASVIKFEQNNYSPESLSPIDIYRQTRNQLSQAKAVLAHA